MLSVLGGLVSYAPLRDAAASGPSPTLTSCWPLLIYGPWLVASLSILRAALHHRRTKHSWTVVMLFSGFAVVLCVAQAPMTVTGVAVAGIPPISALAAFQQIVRQMTLVSPPRHAHPGTHPSAHPSAQAHPGADPATARHGSPARAGLPWRRRQKESP